MVMIIKKIKATMFLLTLGLLFHCSGNDKSTNYKPTAPLLDQEPKSSGQVMLDTSGVVFSIRWKYLWFTAQTDGIEVVISYDVEVTNNSPDRIELSLRELQFLDAEGLLISNVELENFVTILGVDESYEFTTSARVLFTSVKEANEVTDVRFRTDIARTVVGRWAGATGEFIGNNNLGVGTSFIYEFSEDGTVNARSHFLISSPDEYESVRTTCQGTYTVSEAMLHISGSCEKGLDKHNWAADLNYRHERGNLILRQDEDLELNRCSKVDCVNVQVENDGEKTTYTASINGKYINSLFIDSYIVRDDIILIFSATGLQEVKQFQLQLDFDPKDAYEFSASNFVAEAPFLTPPGFSIELLENGQWLTGGASFSTALTGSSALGTLTLAKRLVDSMTPTTITVILFSIGSSSWDREDYSKEVLNIAISDD